MRKLTATTACLVVTTFLCGRALSAPAKPPATTVAQVLDREWTRLEGELIPAAEAMPESKFEFAPTQGEFKGVRTFAQELKHVAYTNVAFLGALLGEKSEYPKEKNGPDALKSKAEIVKYLKDSFAMGHRAMSSLSESTLTERVQMSGAPGPTRLGAANLAVWHSYDHYGQIVEYLRMNGIIPPASRNPHP